MRQLVKVLLDTHVLIWTQEDSEKLGPRARRTLLNESNELWLSSVTVLEISRLVFGERLTLGCSIETWISRAVESMALKSVPIDHRVAAEAYQLPEPLHPDPADRLLIATARLHELHLLTADERILTYRPVPTLDAAR